MQQIKVQRFKWCDVCYQEREQYEEAVEFYVISISDNGRTPLVRHVDTCEVHTKTIRDLRELIKAAGIPTKKAADRIVETPEDVEEELSKARRSPTRNNNGNRAGTCPECGIDLKHGVTGHLVRVHKYAPNKQPLRCPDCGHTAASSNGMRVHRVKSHGYDQTADMVAQHQAKRGKR